jgi:hypothetical protein
LPLWQPANKRAAATKSGTYPERRKSEPPLGMLIPIEFSTRSVMRQQIRKVVLDV